MYTSFYYCVACVQIASKFCHRLLGAFEIGLILTLTQKVSKSQLNINVTVLTRLLWRTSKLKEVNFYEGLLSWLKRGTFNTFIYAKTILAK